MYDEEDLTGGIALTIRVHSDDGGVRGGFRP